MTPDAGLSANTFVTRVIFLFTVALLTACGQSEKPVRQEAQAETADAPLAVSDWYPTPKHKPGFQGSFSSPMNQQSAQMHSRPANQANAQSQPWSVAPQQPAYVQQPPVIIFQGQEYVPAQPQQRWSYQQPVAQPTQPWYQSQQPYAVPGSAYVQRPWGNATSAEDQSQSNASLESWPPGNIYAPARTPAAGGYPANSGGQYWTVPPANYYGNAW
jgi:hypothetical protein